MIELYPHQIQARDFLAARQHAILADAPGVGKTHSACAGLVKVGAKSALIIVPAPMPVKRAWRRIMIETGVCKAEDIQIISSENQVVSAAPFIIVNYEMLENSTVYRAIYWGKYDAIICDEAHRLKSLRSNRSKKILHGGTESLIARGNYKWMLSGTIAPNRPAELYPIMASLFPGSMNGHRSWPDFTKYFCAGYEGADGWNYSGASNVEELAGLLKPHMLRRNLEDVYEDIPDCIERSVYMDVGEMEEDETNTPGASLRKAIGVAKLPYILEYVQSRLIDTQNQDKLLVFCYHREVVETLHNGIPESAILYGGMSSKAKSHSLTSFTSDPAVRVLIAQMNAAGEAIDGMQHACHNVIIAEPDWTQYVQQIARVRRNGQTNPVDVVTLIAEGTLDDVVVPVRKHKAKVINALIQNANPTKEIDMSLEDVVRENTEAVKALTSAIEAMVMVTPTAPNEVVTSKDAAQDTPKASAKSAGSNGSAASAAKVASGGAAPTGPKAKLTVDNIRAAGKEALTTLGDTPENRAKVSAVIVANGGSGKADTVPAKNIAACVAGLAALLDLDPEVEGDDFV